MSDEPKNEERHAAGPAGSAEQFLEDDAEIKEILEQARQNVKHLAREELEGERITQELLDFRMCVRIAEAVANR